MKAIKKYSILLAIPALTFMSSCTKKFEDLNTDKNSATSETTVPLYNLTRAQLEFTGNNDYSFETWRVNIIYLSLMMQQMSSTVGWYSGDKYSRNDGFSASLFTVGYPSQVKYIVDLLNQTKTNPIYQNLYNIGRINRVLIMHRLTDMYGMVPYTQAGLGYIGGNTTPIYDDQKAIYTDMLNELDAAAKALDPNKDAVGKGDLIYQGDLTKWKKLAYSLMIRLGMRMSKVDPAAAQTWVEKGAAGGTLSNINDNAYVSHVGSGGRPTVNRISNILSGEWDGIGKGNVYLSKTFVDFMQSNQDPRLQYYAEIKKTQDRTPANQIGMPNGYDENGANSPTDIHKAPNFPGDITLYSVLRKDIFAKLDGITSILTYAQTELLLAEGAQRGWNVGGTAQQHYTNGVTAAMKQLVQYDASAVITDAQVSQYLTAHPYAAATGLDQINTQYWAASFLDWYEVFSNWRRADYPKLVPVVYTGDNNGGQIPRRMLYPATEASANSKNYNAAITAQGTNNFGTRVWWDKQ
ncbi:SusD-like starch-binding protein associating with outer membrane [Chitinophaga dinghuensis]|uniref:SusD-like starch-binding protein associating with outer membrane n=1 Tax=Chitinophaga dinghuensis TaxID=1539050 RepID=A0A327WE71_9BACT|nr:SusD/RagB family nutrient-binding outer membrane lipoprotein [Chitinophaga dinghuensis]RAJ87706.1 SusD-like starch-binding protein associating with outer membrane [Chitinophaga dinghuensis]